MSYFIITVLNCLNILQNLKQDYLIAKKIIVFFPQASFLAQRMFFKHYFIFPRNSDISFCFFKQPFVDGRHVTDQLVIT